MWRPLRVFSLLMSPEHLKLRSGLVLVARRAARALVAPLQRGPLTRA